MTGTLALARVALRLDRVRLVVWFLAIVGMSYASAAGVQSLYDDPRELVEYAQTVESSSAIVAFTGPTYDIDTPGGRIAYETSSQLAIAIALFALLSMTRHARAEEESGRAELLRAAPTGRHALLGSALLLTVGTSVAIGVGMSGALAATDLPVAGSIAMGALVAGVGIAFAAIGAVAVQVTEHARAASGIALAALGVAFVTRAIGDTSAPALRWLSPIGIAQHTRAFAGERAWPLLVLVAGSAALVAIAVRLSSTRDLGAGLVPTRLGPPRAVPSLGTPFGLALRLQRGVLAGWSAGLFLFGASMGAIAEGAEDLIGDNEEMREIMAQAGMTNIVDSFLATMLLMLALTTCGFALQSAMRVRTEETSNRTELVLASGVSRRSWLGANGAVTVLGTIVVLGAAGLGTGVAHAIQSADAGQVPRLVGAALAQAPAVLLLAAVAVLLFGATPRWLQAAWAPLALAAVVGVLGDLLQVPSWVAALSPFDHLAQVPAESLAVAPFVVLALLAGLCWGVGISAHDRRDVA